MPDTGFTQLETSRLILRHFRDSDLAALVAYRNDPEVARYQSWESISESAAREFIAEQQSLDPGIPGEGFQFAIELKQTGALIGDCYLEVSAEDQQQVEIGYTLARGYQGQGYATEAVSCLLDFVFLTLRLHRVTAMTDTENSRSVALLERLGFRREGHFIQDLWFKGRWVDDYFYAMLREEWLHSRSRGS